MQSRHDRMLELDLRTGKDGLVGSQEPSFTEMLENLSKDDRFAMLHVPNMYLYTSMRTMSRSGTMRKTTQNAGYGRIRNPPRRNAFVYVPHMKAP